MSKNGSGPAKESGLSEFDDIKAHSETLEKTFKQASDIIAACHRGFTPAEKKKFKKELPEIVGRLRQLLEAQLQKGGGIQSLDLADGSYDNVHTDHMLRKQLATLRNLNIDLNTMIGTRTVRKLTGFLREDLPNWFSVTWMQAKDNLKQLAKTGALYGGIGAVAATGGYAAYGALALPGGALAGVGLLGSHLSYVPGAVYNAGSAVASGVSYISGKIGGLLGYGASTTMTAPVAPAVSSAVSATPVASATTAGGGAWSIGAKIKSFLGW